ncbi:MAG TPA: hypothetical protein VKF15_06185 [Nitrososphaerales archaeon]|nr:hypothetical protein [Nitrososphaerales archaeon]
MSATVGAIGAFLLVFGFLFLLISSTVVSALIGYASDPTRPLVLMQLLGIVLASVGAGLLIHGVLSRHAEVEEAPAAETP